MATCPKCLGALTEHHKCPRGPIHRVSDALLTAAIGGLIGWLLCLAIEERPATALIFGPAPPRASLRTSVRPSPARSDKIGAGARLRQTSRAVSAHDIQQQIEIDRFG